MKPFLLFNDRSLQTLPELLWNAQDLSEDLALSYLFKAMANGEEFIHDISRRVVLDRDPTDMDTVLYRQAALQDCLKNPAVIRALYDTAVQGIDAWRSSWFSVFTSHPTSVLSSSREMAGLLLETLMQLRKIAEAHGKEFKSEGFTSLFSRLRENLGDDFFSEARVQLEILRLDGGIGMRAALGAGNLGMRYELLKPPISREGWFQRLFKRKPTCFQFKIHPRDESGLKTLSTLNDKAVNEVADYLARTNDSILGFLTELRAELGFFLGGVHLSDALAALGEPVCFPDPLVPGSCTFLAKGIYDGCLALNMGRRIVANDVQAATKHLIVVTGANQGGKTTFLRSIGLAQLMMRAGLFVMAERLSASLYTALFAHFKREEDASMQRGKFDEELARMDQIMAQVSSGSLFLFNESFAATNEREGAEIARQIVRALIEENHQVFFVTHLYDFSEGFYRHRDKQMLFLRAGKQDDPGMRFRIVEAPPQPTSYGMDIYQRIFGSG